LVDSVCKLRQNYSQPYPHREDRTMATKKKAKKAPKKAKKAKKAAKKGKR
jgi:hypothetical protein